MLAGQFADARPSGSTRRCANCATRLNRYNDGLRCFACSRGVSLPEAAVPAIPPDVWSDREVQQALVERDFGALCLRVRGLTCMRQEDLVLMTGLSQPFLSMLESGRRKLTNIDKIVDLLAGLKVPEELAGLMLRKPNSYGAGGVGVDIPRENPAPNDR
ncbi:helix-turn-helix domain-containing protein [Streptomyces prunicolor]|uniref:helix-turn-helix domain-containing protein n=1 Tax=Streptomyces prunicolor TaxID=67348 RepID=UPI00131A2743|nr:helix-turn-helix transcriptional regulator [Streptomyces prunicolor]